MTVEKIAARLDIHPDTLERWIRQGRIPIKKLGRQVIYREADLERWARRQRLVLKEPDQSTAKRVRERNRVLSAAMRRGGCFTLDGAKEKPDLLRQVVDLVDWLEDPVKDELYELLLAREALTSTGIGKGIAIPHPRNPLDKAIADPVILTCFFEKPIDFDSIDDLPVFVLFLLLSSSVEEHLNLLSRLSYCLRDGAFVKSLKERPESDAFFHAVESLENDIEKKGI